MNKALPIRSTTILAVRRDGPLAIAGDGQVTMGEGVIKHKARKIRRLYGEKVLAGFAGSTADALSLFSRFEQKLEEFHGNLSRAVVELAKDWRTDRALRHLEALLLVADAKQTYLVSGDGDVIEADDGIVAIGSGGPYALGAGRALVQHTQMSARDNGQEAKLHAGPPAMVFYLPESIESATTLDELTPRQIVTELDKYVVGQTKAKRCVAVALRNRMRRQKLSEELAEEILPKNIIMIGPTGIGKTEIARRLARLTNSPFLKVEASRFTEVGYVGRDVESMVRDLVEISIDMVREEKIDEVAEKAEQNAEERILDLLLPPPSRHEKPSGDDKDKDKGDAAVAENFQRTREKLRAQLREGRLDERQVEG